MTNRNKNFIKQLKLSFGYKALSVLVSFLVVRYMLEYLGTELYGVWVVILALMNWIIFFDFGIANGIKNKVAQSLSVGDMKLANEYISTGYIMLSIFSCVAYIIFFIISSFINWQIVFNSMLYTNAEFITLVRVVMFFVLLNFVFAISASVFNAAQKASLTVQLALLSQVFALIFVFLLIKFTNQSLLFMAISYGSAMILANIVLAVFFYAKNKELIPKFCMYQSKKRKDVLGLGIKFFYLQLTIFLIANTDRFIIAQLLDAKAVSSYDILFKYFSVLLVLHGLINGPLWSMYTEAYMKNDYKWISNILKKMSLLMFLYIFISIILYFFGNFFINIWLGKTQNLNIENSNYIYMAIIFLFLIWHSIFAFFTNGINKTTNQMISTSIGAVINIPLSILFFKYFNMGLNGILLATIISLSIFCITGSIQAIMEIKNMKQKDIRQC